jgi:hypothetical protein
MAGATERITHEVRDISPDAACLLCLATRTGLSESDARNAAQAPVTRGELLIVTRTCHWCLDVTKALIIAVVLPD